MSMEITKELDGKRLLLLGGSLWKDAIAKFAKENNIHLFATGSDQSAGIFSISEEGYSIDSTDENAMKKLILENNIDGIYMGGSERVISFASKYLNELNKPCYCTKEQWDSMQNKSYFKEACIEAGLPVVTKYNLSLDEIENFTKYPVITKPADGCGSSGFSICNNSAELKEGFLKACAESESGRVIVEDYVDNSGIVVFYTLSNGKIIYSGIEDKYPVQYGKDGSFVGGLFVFESKIAPKFRAMFEQKLQKLVDNVGMKEGNFWIEVFTDGEKFYFNEAGYRYGGSASLYPIDYMYGINQVGADIYYALTGKSILSGLGAIFDIANKKKYYAVYPIYANGGLIISIANNLDIGDDKSIVKLIIKESVGSTIHATGTFSQAIALAHIVFENEEELKTVINQIHDNFKIIDDKGNNLIYRMLNIDDINLK